MPEEKKVEVVIFGKKGADIEGSDRLFVKWDKKEAWFIAGWKVPDLRDNKGVKVSYVDGFYGDWAARNHLKIIPEDIAGRL